MDKEKEALLAEVLSELDEMLEAHEKYAEEYGKKCENLTLEQIKELDLKELRYSFIYAIKTATQIENMKKNNKPIDKE